MSRRFPWKHKPSSDDVRLIQRCIAPDPTAPTLFLLSEVGATQFILQSSSAPTSPSPLPSLSSPPPSVTKHRVMIGDTQRCTCGDAKEGHRLCCHLLFVMLKVMRVKESDPLVWQLALTETEVTAVVKGRWEWKEEGRRRRKRGRVEEKGREQGSAQAGQVQRKAVEADDVCVVCQEEMRGEDGGVVLGLCWCDAGCGSALHARCMRVWAEHQSAQTGSAITCPVSRRDSTRKHTSLYLLTVNSPHPAVRGAADVPLGLVEERRLHSSRPASAVEAAGGPRHTCYSTRPRRTNTVSHRQEARAQADAVCGAQSAVQGVSDVHRWPSPTVPLRPLQPPAVQSLFLPPLHTASAQQLRRRPWR